jgi:hypothetical protein
MCLRSGSPPGQCHKCWSAPLDPQPMALFRACPAACHPEHSGCSTRGQLQITAPDRPRLAGTEAPLGRMQPCQLRPPRGSQQPLTSFTRSEPCFRPWPLAGCHRHCLRHCLRARDGGRAAALVLSCFYTLPWVHNAVPVRGNDPSQQTWETKQRNRHTPYAIHLEFYQSSPTSFLSCNICQLSKRCLLTSTAA